MTKTILLMLVATIALPAQTPEVRQARGELEGRVVTQEGRPLAGALVMLHQSGKRTNAWTGLDGIYSFQKLTPARYRVSATKSGYSNDTVAASVRAGGEAEAPELRLHRLGVVAGTVTTPEGLPMVGANLQLWRLAWRRGRMVLAAYGSVSADDRGRYRLFDLWARDYLVSLVPARAPAEQGRVELLSAPRVYPEESVDRELGTIHVGRGDRIEGVDFRGVEPANTKLNGRIVLDPRPAPCGDCQVEISRLTVAGPLPVVRLLASEGGLFSVTGLEPDLYQVAVQSRDTGAPHVALARISLSRDRTTSETIRAKPPIKIAGSVRLIDPPSDFFNPDGGWLAPAQIRVRHRGPGLLRRWGALLEAQAKEGEDAAIELEAELAPGEYELPQLMSPHRRGYLRRFLVNGRPHRDPALDLSAHMRRVRLDFELAFDAGAIEGRVELGDRDSSSLMSVRLEPLDPSLMMAGFIGRIGTDGRYRIDNAAPGKYWVYASQRGVLENAGNPAVRAKYERFGREVDVRPGEIVSADLRLIE